MMRDKRRKWLSGVGGVVLIGGLALANYGGGVTLAEAHENHHNPFKQILAKLEQILAKLNNGAPTLSSGGVAGNQTLRWDTNNPSSSRFTEVFSGAILDKNTGLVWEKMPTGSAPSTWDYARLQCVNQSIAGTRGWRLPSVVELTSVIDPTVQSVPPIPATAFSVNPATYWTATTATRADGLNNTASTANAYTVDFTNVNAMAGTTLKTDAISTRFWCVRGPSQESAY